MKTSDRTPRTPQSPICTAETVDFEPRSEPRRNPAEPRSLKRRTPLNPALSRDSESGLQQQLTCDLRGSRGSAGFLQPCALSAVESRPEQEFAMRAPQTRTVIKSDWKEQR